MASSMWDYIIAPNRGKVSLIEMLRELLIFEGLSNTQLIQVERVLHERSYRKEEPIFREGDPGAGMYIVKSGEVVISKALEGDKNIELAVINEGCFFGELALLDEAPRSASALPKVDTVLLGFCKPDLDNICERNPRLGILIVNNISRLICKRLIRANEDITRLQPQVHKGKITTED